MKLWHWCLDFVARWLQPWLSFAAAISGTLLQFDYKEQRAQLPKWVGLFDFLASGVFFWVFLISASASVIFGFLLARREKTLAQLRARISKHQSEIDEIGNNIINVFDGLLLNLGTKLGIQQSDQVRLSLYVHDKVKRRFLPCGRYSPNPTYQAPGRTHYPDSEGCIAEGWNKGWHFDNEVPEAAGARKTYNKNKYKISDQVNAAIRMQSRLYAVKRLDNALGQPVAVLVVEALQNEHFEADVIQTQLEGVADDFSRMIHTLRGYIPDPAKAAEKGL